MALWIYRNNAKYQGDTVSVGDWNEFFDEYGADGPTEWGSTEWIRSHESRKIIREELQTGDLFLCWQTNKNAAIGLARFVEPRLVGEWTELWLEPVQPFPAPVPLRDMAKKDDRLARVNFFAKHSQGTLARASAAEGRVLLRACGVDPATLTLDPSAIPPSELKRRGAGFGEFAENVIVENAAMGRVIARYTRDGWSVDNVSTTRGLGYDLVSTKGNAVRHVEVKGIRGSRLVFILTENERLQSEKDPAWRLVAVLRALEARPVLKELTGAQVKQMRRRAISYMYASY